MLNIYNSRYEEYKKPFGAVKAGEEVSFTLRVPPEVKSRTPMLFLQPDGGEPQQHALQPAGAENGRELFTVTLTAPPTGLYFYWFDLWIDYKKLYRGLFSGSEIRTDEGAKWPLLVYDPEFKTPQFARSGVMYQIFPDRFFEGDPDKQRLYSERVYRQDKQNEPYFWGEEKTYGNLTQDYFGGDLAGIEKRLPFLKSLGVTIIYLNPIFEAHSNHRYNTADYMKVDPYLGTNEDFRRLCTAANDIGIKIILDGVFSHTGSDSLYFNKEGRYPSVGAWQGPQSPYRNWYFFHPDGNYDSWWGFDTLPNCNKHNAEFRSFIAGEGGVVDYWLGLGASGFRLDVADELPDDFIEEIRCAVKRNGQDNLLIGEVWEDAVLKEGWGSRRRYFWGGELDGVMNYPFRTAILSFLQSFDALEFSNAVMNICELYPPMALASCTTHISTHDTARAITAIKGEPQENHDRSWQSVQRLSREQYHLGITCMRLAFVLQFTLPGIPCVYYGDEIAMQGYADPFNRGYYNWTSGENRLIPLMIELSALRRQCPAMQSGSLRFIEAKNGLLVYQRESGEAKMAVAVNCSGWPAVANLLGQEVPVANMNYAIRTLGCEQNVSLPLDEQM